MQSTLPFNFSLNIVKFFLFSFFILKSICYDTRCEMLLVSSDQVVLVNLGQAPHDFSPYFFLSQSLIEQRHFVPLTISMKWRSSWSFRTVAVSSFPFSFYLFIYILYMYIKGTF